MAESRKGHREKKEKQRSDTGIRPVPIDPLTAPPVSLSFSGYSADDPRPPNSPSHGIPPSLPPLPSSMLLSITLLSLTPTQSNISTKKKTNQNTSAAIPVTPYMPFSF